MLISGFTGKSWLSPSVQQGHLLHRGQQGQRGGQGEAQEGEAGGGDQVWDSVGGNIMGCSFVSVILFQYIYILH